MESRWGYRDEKKIDDDTSRSSGDEKKIDDSDSPSRSNSSGDGDEEAESVEQLATGPDSIDRNMVKAMFEALKLDVCDMEIDPDNFESLANRLGSLKICDQIPAYYRLPEQILLPVDNQRGRGICYAYSALDALSSLLAAITPPPRNIPIPLSVKEIGCNIAERIPVLRANQIEGNWPLASTWYTYQYIMNLGVTLRRDHDFASFEDESFKPCEAPLRTHRVWLSGHSFCINQAPLRETTYFWNGRKYDKILTSNDILRKLTKQPICGAIIVYPSFRRFSGKHIYAPTEKEMKYQDVVKKDLPKHTFPLIGFGDEDNIEFFTIKNSWGTQWGDGGFAKVRRDTILSFSYPRQPFLHGPLEPGVKPRFPAPVLD